MLEKEESVPCMVEIYKNKRAVILNGARNAPTELEMEGFVMILYRKSPRTRSRLRKISTNHEKYQQIPNPNSM
jgi:hypothetical protein